VIWVEILSRHHEVVARFRINGTEARVGRGYDNDVIVDDPYVAAQHVRVFHDSATGQLVAEDMGSSNGMFLDGGRSRLARVLLDGKDPIRIGQTYLRIRGTGHEVEAERVARPDRKIPPVVPAMAVFAAILAVDAAHIWLSQTSEPRASNYLTPLLTVAASVFTWTGIWALLSRVFSGRASFLRNLLIALSGTFVVSLYNSIALYFAYAWASPVLGTYLYVASWSILATVCFFHLGVVGVRRFRPKAAFVIAMFLVGVTVQTLQRSEAFSDSGRRTDVRRLMPPWLRAIPLRDEGAFFGEIGDLKAKLDADRSRPKPVGPAGAQ
jgi:hypothetical protein